MRRIFAAFAVIAAITAPPALAQPGASEDPQLVALAALHAASSMLPAVQTTRGLPRSIALAVPVVGATPLARADAFLATYAPLLLQDGGALELVPAGTWASEDGSDAVVFSQRYHGIPVFAARLVLRIAAPDPASGQAHVMQVAAALATNEADVAIAPGLAASQAEDAARSAAGTPSANVHGQTRLVLFDPAVFDEDGPARLAWTVTLDGPDPAQLLIDAATGALLHRSPLTASGAGLDLIVQDAQLGSQGDFPWCFFFGRPTIGNENGVTSAYASDLNGSSVWLFARRTYVFLANGFGIHSWDGNDGEIKAYAHASAPNAQYVSGCGGMEFRDGWVSQDVVAHEFTHGLIAHHPSNLKYEGQPGALNESLADAIATFVTDPLDYLLGEDRIGGGGAVRSMADPPAGGDPDRWSEFVVTQDDNGGVHTNSGITNKAFYLMAEGGAFDNVTTAGMGQTKAAWIALSLARYLPSSASLMDARNQAVGTAIWWATQATHGFGAADLCTVRNAFAAVELGDGDADCDGVENGPGDSDGDGIVDSKDNCPANPNPKQRDVDHDGLGDPCDPDPDYDKDGWPNHVDDCPYTYNPGQQDQDGDGQGDACDADADGDGVVDWLDNCYLPNPSQADGDGDGIGDACDPDYDGDGLYDADNCPFVENHLQEDADGDGYGDACDRCPDTPDAVLAYTLPTLLDPIPHPYQPDSDGDGTPDACDALPFGLATLTLDGAAWNPRFPFASGTQSLGVEGPPGSEFEIPLPVCDPPAGTPPPLGPDDRVELRFEGIAGEDLQVGVTDDLGRFVAIAAPATPLGGLVGLRFHADCGSAYFLHFRFGPAFDGQASMLGTLERVDATPDNPWSAGDDSPYPPVELPDSDGDGSIDAADNCPAIANPTQQDTDRDGLGDVCDPTPIPEPGSAGTAVAAAALAALALRARRRPAVARAARRRASATRVRALRRGRAALPRSPSRRACAAARSRPRAARRRRRAARRTRPPRPRRRPRGCARRAGSSPRPRRSSRARRRRCRRRRARRSAA